MAKNKLRDYHEPWHATQDTTWETCFRNPPIESEYVDADKVAAWHNARAAAEERAHWFVWASRMNPPAIHGPDAKGHMKVWDGRGIIGWTRNLMSGVEHKDMANRVCECVNACQAIADPMRAIADMRALLRDIVTGETGPDDVRIVSLLSRLIPADEIKAFMTTHEAVPETDHGD